MARQYILKVANSGNASQELASVKALAGHMQDIQGQVKLIQKGAARATGAGNFDIQPLSLDPATMQVLGMTSSPEEVAAVLRGPGAISKTIGVADEFRINAMLSGFRSIMTHAGGIALNSVVMPVEKYLLGAALSGNRDNIMTEGAGYAYGAFKSLWDATRLTAKAMYNEAPILDNAGGLTEHTPATSPQAFSVDPSSVLGQIISGAGKLVRMPTMGPRCGLCCQGI
jgi:hypothetical protein